MSETRLKKIMNIDWTLIIENFKCIDRPKIFTQNWIGNLCYIYNCSIFFSACVWEGRCGILMGAVITKRNADW